MGAGARFVEVDVQLSSDGRPVLFHDRTLSRLCGVHGAVHGRTLADLLSLSCAERGRFGDRFAAVRIAELSGLVDLLERHPGVFAFVEIKRLPIERFGSAEILERVLPVLEPVRSRVALISFSLPFLTDARARTTLPIGAVFDRFDEREGARARSRGRIRLLRRDGSGRPLRRAAPGWRCTRSPIESRALAARRRNS
jgi:glycerophosphoryl diester phosphodiesterase